MPRSFDLPGLILSSVPLVLLVALIVGAPDTAQAWIELGFAGTTWALGAVWQGLLIAIFVVAMVLALSPWGRARLGGPEAEASLGFVPWLAVLLCTLLAGGGVFFSAAEPMFHLQTPPPVYADAVEPMTRPALTAAMSQSFLHWGFLAWAVVGTLPAIALSAANTVHGHPLRPRSLWAPLLGRVALGPLGSVLDAIAVIAVVAGTVGPIGFLALQLGAAAELLAGLPNSLLTQGAALLGLVVLYTASALSGLTRGIAWLSRLNVVLALVLGGLVLVLGPTGATLGLLADAFGSHLIALPALAIDRTDAAWNDGWTLFYWGWFLGYAPLMAVFTARASRGRTVRQLVLAVAILAPLVTMIWFTTLGGTAGLLELSEPGVISQPLADSGMGAALIATLQALPGAALTLPLALLLIFCFLATTGDSMAFAISVVQSGRSDPPAWLRVLWALLMGALAAALLAIGDGGIQALQRFIVVAAGPVTLLIAPTVVTGVLGARDLLRATPQRTGTSPASGRSDTSPGSEARPQES